MMRFFFFFCVSFYWGFGFIPCIILLRVFILERASSIQYVYRKIRTRARVLSRTLAHGNSKIEIRQLKIKGKKSRRKEWMWKEPQWARKSPVNLNVKSHLSSSVTSATHDRPSRNPPPMIRWGSYILLNCGLIFINLRTAFKNIGRF